MDTRSNTDVFRRVIEEGFNRGNFEQKLSRYIFDSDVTLQVKFLCNVNFHPLLKVRGNIF